MKTDVFEFENVTVRANWGPTCPFFGGQFLGGEECLWFFYYISFLLELRS